MATYSIKDLEKLSGIKAHTIRIWEKRYNLVEPKRTDTNIRYYDDEDLKKILNVALLNRNGVKISHIAQLDEEQIFTKVNKLSESDKDKENTIDNLIISMIDLDEVKFEKVLSNAILKNGFEETVIGTLYPFFEKIGVLWLTGAINPAQEHFISNLVRQKLIVAIDGIVEKPAENRKNFILFLPEGELHELGLLFYYYLIKKQGHSVTYLGQTVPLADIYSVVKVRHCDYLFTSFHSSISGININEYIMNMATKFPGINVLYTTFDPDLMDERMPENVIRVRGGDEFMQFLDHIEDLHS